MKLIDIHCHILPGLDDGAADIETAKRMLDEAYRQGVRYIVATPHYRPGMFEPSMRGVLMSYRGMRKYAENIGIGLRLGCEHYRNEQIIRNLDNRLRPTMLGSRYVLIEFSGNDNFVTIRNYVYSLVMHGYYPIIAHIERYFCCQEAERVFELKNLGALIQINADSVLGYNGRRTKNYCFGLMRKELVDFIASDAHDLKNRKMHLKECASCVEKKFGFDYAKRIFWQNPGAIWKDGKDKEESRCRDEKNKFKREEKRL